MYYQLTSSTTIQPQPRTMRVMHADGSFSDKASDILFADEAEANLNGFYALVETPKPEGDYTANYALVGNKIVQSWEVSPPQPRREFSFTKLQARRAFRSLGVEAQWDMFTSALTGEMLKDFDDANELRTDDPDVVQMMDVFLGMAGLTEEQAYNALKEQANII